ncbi:MAG: type II toxin-antitoxin system VapC family toxin [Terriglobales bacterium]
MRTAVDSSVLLDVLTASPVFAPASQAALRKWAQAGSLLICAAVWAEVRAFFAEDAWLERELDLAHILFDPWTRAAANRAGGLWREYTRGRAPERRVLADFLIGAHALEQADALLTRDRGFYRVYFRSLRLLEP